MDQSSYPPESIDKEILARCEDSRNGDPLRPISARRKAEIQAMFRNTGQRSGGPYQLGQVVMNHIRKYI